MREFGLLAGPRTGKALPKIGFSTVSLGGSPKTIEMNNFPKQALITICLLFVAGCSLFSGKVGILTGQVTIGPHQPIHREGETEPTPPPELYAAWQIVIYTKDMQREIARANIDPEGNYQIVLPVSSYSVRAEPVRYNGGPGISDVYELIIAEDEITYLNLDVDTGIR